MRPTWTPDGKAFLYDSDEMGSNDIAIVPATAAIRSCSPTIAMGEFSPAPSPDGTSFAFVSNRTGPMTLYIAPIGGGPVIVVARGLRGQATRRRADRARPRTRRRRQRRADARAHRGASERRSRVRAGRRIRTRDRGERDALLPHDERSSMSRCPPGQLAIEALRGFEYRPATSTVDVKPGATATVTLTLRRLVDAPAMGWYSRRHARARSASGPLRPHAPDAVRSVARRGSASHERADSHGRHAHHGALGRSHRQTGSAFDADAHHAVRRGVPRIARAHRDDRHQDATCCRSPAARTTRRTRRSRATCRTSTARARRAASRVTCIRTRARRRIRRRIRAVGRLADSGGRRARQGRLLRRRESLLGRARRRPRCTTGCSTAASACRRRAAPTTSRTSGAIRRRAPIARTRRSMARSASASWLAGGESGAHVRHDRSAHLSDRERRSAG